MELFELTNEQRKCFALPAVQDSWKRVVVPAGSDDNYKTYAFLDKEHIVKVIQVSDKAGYALYLEYCVDQMISPDGTKILPKTDKGKPQNFTGPNLIKKTPVGMAFSYCHDSITIHNNDTEQCYYRSEYTETYPKNLNELSEWAKNWCLNTGEKELAELKTFSKQKKVHQKFREGDFFRYRIDRNLYGYGRILVDYAKMKKDKIPFWDDIFMGKPLCVAIYHIATKDPHLTPAQLVTLKMLPSQMIMDNIFYYGECQVIGNQPLAQTEKNYTVHYGKSLDSRQRQLHYQCGKTFVSLENAEELCSHFKNNSIGWGLDVKLPILLACIEADSNAPYWEMAKPWKTNQDLRNPKFEHEWAKIKKQMGIP